MQSSEHRNGARAALCVCLANLAAACSEGGKTDGGVSEDAGPAVPVECELGIPNEDGAFTSIAATSSSALVRSEIRVGFQNFVFLQFMARIATTATKDASAAMVIHVDGEEPDSSAQRGIRVKRQPSGPMLADDIRLLLDVDRYVNWVGKNADITIKLDGPGWTCTMQGRVKLIDEDHCIHTDQEPICPDAGVSDAGATDTGTTARDAGAVDANSVD